MAIKDLGWMNAGGETERKIQEANDACPHKAERKPASNEGAYGTVHTVTCEKCGWCYHYDSGD